MTETTTIEDPSKKPLTLIFITLLIDVIGFGIIIPILPTLLKTLGGYNLSEASAIGAWMIVAFAVQWNRLATTKKRAGQIRQSNYV